MITPEQLCKIGSGVRVLAKAMTDAGLEKHFSVGLTPFGFCELKAADRMLSVVDLNPPKEDKTIVGVPVTIIRTNGDY